MKAKIFLGLIAVLLVMPIGFAHYEPLHIDTTIGADLSSWLPADVSLAPSVETVEGGVSMADSIDWDDVFGGSELNDDDINSELDLADYISHNHEPVEGRGEVIL